MNTAKLQPFDFDVTDYPRLPRLPGLLVTGTDTEVGKTLIAGAIARRLHLAGLDVEVFKPVATGCRRAREGLISEDAEFLAACAESRLTLAEIAPLRYATPAAPNVAAARERRPVDLDVVFEAYEVLTRRADIVVVEGIGGLLCPITDEFWMIHLARMMHLPVVIVARAGLGTINHTLLTIHAATSAALDLAGVIVNRYRIDLETPDTTADPPPRDGRESDLAMYTNPTQIAGRGRVPVLAVVPDEPANSVKNATVGPDTTFAISQVDWQGLLGLHSPPTT